MARYSVWHARALVRSLKRALQHVGFAFVEVLSSCPTQFGRRNENPTPVGMLQALRQDCVSVEKAQQLSPGELEGKTIIGELVS